MSGALTFERTEDWELIRKIALHPKIWPLISDDLSPEPEVWQPVQRPDIWYVLAREHGKPIGLFVFSPENSVCWQSHIAMLPEAWGATARAAFTAVFPWLWERTPCQRIIGSVPVSNSLAILFAIQCGMLKFGMNPKSTLRDGKLEDQVMLGISKPEAPCHS